MDFSMEFPLLGELKETKDVCPVHGKPLVQLRDLKPFCIECRKQQLIEAEQTEAKLASMKHQRRRTIEMLKKDSIVGDPSLWNASFSNYEPEDEESERALLMARRAAGSYMKKLDAEKECLKMIADENNTDEEREEARKKLDLIPSFNTLFTGVPGVGKSHLAMAMLQAVNENSKELVSCLFISLNDMFRLIKASFDDRQSKYTELNMTDLLSKVDLLVLDDLGSESSFKRENREAGEYIQNVIFGVLNARQRTIITTNLNNEQLEKIYNPKITSRIYKGVDGHIIKFTKKTQDKRSKPRF